MKVRCVNIRFFLLISAFLLISHSIHSTSYADITPVSDRTSQVRDAIVAAVPNIDTAADVTETHLATITSLNLRAKSISALKSGDFSGLTGLTDLNLYGNQLSNLPNGIFEGLTALTTLRLGGNTVDPMPITVSLEKVGDNQFKAVAPIGAPFDIVYTHQCHEWQYQPITHNVAITICQRQHREQRRHSVSHSRHHSSSHREHQDIAKSTCEPLRIYPLKIQCAAS